MNRPTYLLLFALLAVAACASAAEEASHRIEDTYDAGNSLATGRKLLASGGSVTTVGQASGGQISADAPLVAAASNSRVTATRKYSLTIDNNKIAKKGTFKQTIQTQAPAGYAVISNTEVYYVHANKLGATIGASSIRSTATTNYIYTLSLTFNITLGGCKAVSVSKPTRSGRILKATVTYKCSGKYLVAP